MGLEGEFKNKLKAQTTYLSICASFLSDTKFVCLSLHLSISLALSSLPSPAGPDPLVSTHRATRAIASLAVPAAARQGNYY